MPVLKQRQNGGYYIQGKVPGVGRVSTWQVTPEGLALLCRNGITVGDKFPGTLLRELRDRGLIFTFGRGFGLEAAAVIERPLASSPDLLPLLFREDEDGWHLQLVLPALPKSFLPMVGTDDAAFDMLDRCFLRVDQTKVVSAWHLWPGKGDAICQVEPHEAPYLVEPVGAWPAEWDLMAWARGTDGLRATGTLFAATALVGARLRVGEPVAPDSSYYLVLQNTAVPMSADGVLPIPPGLHPRELAPFGSWKAWQIDIPATEDDRVRTWCHYLGHPVGELPYLLELILPPPRRYSDSGLPIVELGHEAIIAVHPPLFGSEPADPVELLAERDGSALGPVRIESASAICQVDSTSRDEGRRSDWWNGRPGETVYLAWPITHEGVYRFRASTGRATPLTFVAVSLEQGLDPMDVVTEPAPLEVNIAGGGSEARVQAFESGSGPHEIDLSSIGSTASPVITVRCPVPVDVSWSSGQIRGRSRRVCPDEVHDLLAADLREGLSSGRLFLLQVDAGNFGRLRVRLLPATTAQLSTVVRKSLSGAITLPREAVQRARWLRQAVPALLRRPDVTAVPLPDDVRAALAGLENEAGASAIAKRAVVPLLLMPHLKELAQASGQPARSRPNKDAQSTDHCRDASMSQGDESPGSVGRDTS